MREKLKATYNSVATSQSGIPKTSFLRGVGGGGAIIFPVTACDLLPLMCFDGSESPLKSLNSKEEAMHYAHSGTFG